MSLKDEVEAYRLRMEEFNRWEAEQPLVDRDPSAILADLGFLLRFVPREEWLRDPDPEKIGIQRMRAALALITQHDRT